MEKSASLWEQRTMQEMGEMGERFSSNFYLSLFLTHEKDITVNFPLVLRPLVFVAWPIFGNAYQISAFHDSIDSNEKHSKTKCGPFLGRVEKRKREEEKGRNKGEREDKKEREEKKKGTERVVRREEENTLLGYNCKFSACSSFSCCCCCCCVSLFSEIRIKFPPFTIRSIRMRSPAVSTERLSAVHFWK